MDTLAEFSAEAVRVSGKILFSRCRKSGNRGSSE